MLMIYIFVCSIIVHLPNTIGLNFFYLSILSSIHPAIVAFQNKEDRLEMIDETNRVYLV